MGGLLARIRQVLAGLDRVGMLGPQHSFTLDKYLLV
jgi:hypothetical protein